MSFAQWGGVTDLKPPRCSLSLPIAEGARTAIAFFRLSQTALTRLIQNGSRHPLRTSPIGHISLRVHPEHFPRPIKPVSWATPKRHRCDDSTVKWFPGRFYSSTCRNSLLQDVLSKCIGTVVLKSLGNNGWKCGLKSQRLSRTSFKYFIVRVIGMWTPPTTI